MDENETKQYMGYKIIGFFASKVFNDLIDIELIVIYILYLKGTYETTRK